MGILDRFRKKQVAPEARQVFMPTSLQISGPHPVERMLSGISSTAGQRLDYMQEVRISRLMYDIFPFAKRAIHMMASMVGEPYFTDEAGAEVSELSAIMADMPIVSELDWITPRERGADNLAQQIARTMLVFGMAFTEDRYTEGDLNSYEGVLLFDSTSFYFDRPDSRQPVRLRYLQNQYPTVSQFFRYGGFDYRNDSPWAAPLLSGGGFFTEILVALLLSVKNVANRASSPIEVMLVSLKDDSRILNDSGAKTAYTDAMNTLEAQLRIAAQRSAQEGKGQVIVGKTPASIDLLSRSFGADAARDTDPDLLQLILVAFASLLNVPVEFLGFVAGSSGFSPERFRALYRIWRGQIKGLRDTVRTMIVPSIENYVSAVGGDISELRRYRLEFRDVDVYDEDEQAGTEKTKAETAKIWAEVSGLVSQVDTNLARSIMERISAL